MTDDLGDAVATVRRLRADGLTTAEIIALVHQPIPRGQLGGDDAVDAVLNAWSALQRPQRDQGEAPVAFAGQLATHGADEGAEAEYNRLHGVSRTHLVAA